ncbi:MAG: hypothetical protein EA352_06850 [Gemmatimonadales bacterium]|nr:MAG: hypothetical protein EA352_06850 [Gemmatimonadales bacterium]
MTLPPVSRLLLPGLVAATLAACAQPDTSGAHPAIPHSATSGYLHLEDDGTPGFEACGEDGQGTGQVETLEDRSGEDLAGLVRDLGYGDRQVQVHAVVEDGALLEIRVAVPEAPACDRILPDGEVQGRGNEPFWSLKVTDGALVFRSPEELDGVRYEDGRWVPVEEAGSEDGPWRFEADGAWLELRAERCFDTMSGAWYPFTARGERGGTEYRGCGLEGRGAADGIAGDTGTSGGSGTG